MLPNGGSAAEPTVVCDHSKQPNAGNTTQAAHFVHIQACAMLSKCFETTALAPSSPLCTHANPTNHLLPAMQCSDGGAGKLLMRWRTHCRRESQGGPPTYSGQLSAGIYCKSCENIREGHGGGALDFSDLQTWREDERFQKEKEYMTALPFKC